VLVFSSVIVVLLMCFYHAKSNWYLGGVLICAILSFVASTVAYLYRSSPNRSRCCLYISLLFTLCFLTFLIRITSGSGSPFFHLYLYLPAVVFMVAQRDRKAEIAASIGVFISFLINQGIEFNWEAWKIFHTTNWYQYLEITIIASLLILLCFVNREIENLLLSNN